MTLFLFLLVTGVVVPNDEAGSPAFEHRDGHPTMSDYWDGAAYFKIFYSEPGHAHRATEIVPVNGVWYRFERYIDKSKGGELGMNVRQSTDRGLHWTTPVVITTPGGEEDWSCMGTDCGAYYDGKRWHLLFQSLSLKPGSRWNISYLACDKEDATSGTWFTPPDIVNPVIRNQDIWDQIAVGDNNCTRITRGQKRVYDEGTPAILVDNGTIYVTFHGASNTHGTVFGYRGIATTTDFKTYTKAADDCIFSRLDAKDWNVDWNRNGSVGGGAAVYLKDGEYWYMLIESPDISLACVEGQNWPFGLMRSRSLTSTKWEDWAGNPLPEFTPVGPAVSAWTYPALFNDNGITYLAVSQCYKEHAYRQYQLVWKEDVSKPWAIPAKKQKSTLDELKPVPLPVKTDTAYKADMTSADGWKLMGKVPAGSEGSFLIEDGKYLLAQDEISRPIEIDLSKKPVFSITVDEVDSPRLFVRLQIPGLPLQPGYETGYIGFEALEYQGVNTFDVNEELEWIGYFDDNVKDIKNCTLSIWAHLSQAKISDIRIDYYHEKNE